MSKKQEYANIIRFAMSMEKDGANFFRESAERFKNPTSRKMFLQLAKVEESHYDYLKDMLGHYEEGSLSELDSESLMEKENKIFEMRSESEHLDTTLNESDTPDMTILRMAYLIEKDFAEFYEEAAEDVDDEELKALFNKLATWERGHESLFKKEYRRLMKEYMSMPWGG